MAPLHRLAMIVVGAVVLTGSLVAPMLSPWARAAAASPVAPASGPVVTSPGSTIFVAGAPGSFTVTAAGQPAPSVEATGDLPDGITWTDHGNGTATLAGTPGAVTTETAHSIAIRATNGSGTAVQSFVLTVAPAPISGGTVPPVGTPPTATGPASSSASAGGGRLASTGDGRGYWIAAADGSVTAYGTAVSYGSMAGHPLNRPVVGMAATPDGLGYWLVASDGGVFSFGDAPFDGSTGDLRLNRPIVGVTGTPDGKGYWLVASDGGVFSFGDAPFDGSTGNLRLNRPIVGMASTPDGTGYWLVASDGGVFGFGAARFHGSTGSLTLSRPVIGVAVDRTGGGYWLVASDGGIFAFGDAAFYGSEGNTGRTAVGLITSPGGPGYAVIDTDGTRDNFGW